MYRISTEFFIDQLRHLSKHLAKHLATDLAEDLAFLKDGSTLFYATQPLKPSIAPHSAIIDLIQGIYEKFPDDARRILRNRIYSTLDEPSLMCTQMIKVAAKRMTPGVRELPFPVSESMKVFKVTSDFANPPDLNLLKQVESMNAWSMTPHTHEDFMKLAFQIASWPDLNPAPIQRQVAAILVTSEPNSEKTTILAACRNTNAKNKTLHAEVNLVQSLYQETGQIIPANSRIYTTLKPCRMCASMIWCCASDRTSLEVFYGADDPGPHARDLVLPPLHLKPLYL